MIGKLIVFDFDGVLGDSFNTFYTLIRDSMKTIGLPLTPDQYRSFFMGNVHQGFKDFINDEYKYLIFSEFRKNNYDKYYNAQLFPEVVGFLEKLKKDHILTIASSGRKANIINLLEENGVDKMFGLILATAEYTKENMIEKILTQFNTNPEETAMITDTVGDIAIAKKIGLKTIAVTWGFQSIDTLKSAKPDLIVSSFKDLIDNI